MGLIRHTDCLNLRYGAIDAGAIAGENILDVSENNAYVRPADFRLDRADVGDMREIMLEFESLGGHPWGCEFGTVQRAFGAEPLGLLRWTEMPVEYIIKALKTRFFVGVGLPENTEIFEHENGNLQDNNRIFDER